MTTISNIPKPDGGFYQVGDTLATKEEALAFAQAVGWEFFLYLDSDNLLQNVNTEEVGPSAFFEDWKALPYTITGFRPVHTATITTTNPPLTADECIGKTVWVYDPSRPNLEPEQHVVANSASHYHTLLAFMSNGLHYYQHCPLTVPPTPRGDD
jgi:hypothetical protein